MNFYYFIAQRLGKTQKKSFSSIVTSIAIASIAIGLGIILIAFGILNGFKKNIQDKLFSFSGHIQITQRSLNNSYQETPISTQTHLYKDYKKNKSISHLYLFAQKAGVLKTDEEVLGVVLKGFAKDYETKLFEKNMVAGNFLNLQSSKSEDEILISQRIANKLKLKLNDSIVMFFVQDPPRFRKLAIKGIYQTGMDEFDEKVIIGNLNLIRRLNQWADTLAGGYEIHIADFANLDDIAYSQVWTMMNYEMEMETVTQKFADVFDWLLLLNKNVTIFLTLILIVASFNMISILLIMMLERIQMIGILKALGATNWQIRRIFIYKGVLLIFKGLLLGDFIGLGFCALQYYLQIIPLDPENYYMNTVPIEWDWLTIGLMNLLVFIIVTLVLMIPTFIITRIQPIKAIRFD